MRQRSSLGDFVRGVVDLAEDPDKRLELEGKVRELGGRLKKTLEDPATLAHVMKAAGEHRIDVREARRRTAHNRRPRRSRA